MTPVADTLTLPGLIGTFMGRDALALAASYLELNKDETVLLPAYNCKEVIRPFARTAKVKLYDVRPDLSIDPDEIRNIISYGRVRLMVMINYFGFLQPHRREIKKACEEQGVILLEDCAHSLLTDGSGETGDLSVYSFRKLLPVPDGGALRVNLNGKKVTPRFYPSFVSNALSLAILAKSLSGVQSDKFSRAGVADQTEGMHANGNGTAHNRRVLPLSWFARRGINHAAGLEIAQKKVSDYQYWNRQVPSLPDVLAPVYESLPPGACPLGFPVRVKDRDAKVARAKAAGIPLRVHWRLAPSLEKECPNSYRLSTEVLTLPVYPELGTKERNTLNTILSSN